MMVARYHRQGMQGRSSPVSAIGEEVMKRNGTKEERESCELDGENIDDSII